MFLPQVLCHNTPNKQTQIYKQALDQIQQNMQSATNKQMKNSKRANTPTNKFYKASTKAGKQEDMLNRHTEKTN